MIKNKQLFVAVAFGFVTIALVSVIGFLMVDNIKQQVVALECCNGVQCSDTYYTQEDNLCHLVLCENNFFTNKSQCVYPGKNITANITYAT